MNDGFAVDAAALDAHAWELDTLAGRMAAATAAGRPLDLMAYGLLGQVFAMAAARATTTGSVAVATLADRMVELGDGVRATRECYLRVEHHNVTGFGGPR